MTNHTTFVIAKKYIDLIIDKLKVEEEQKRKSDLKREKAILMTWKKIMVSLKIMKKVQEAYGGDNNGHLREKMNPFIKKNRSNQANDTTVNLLGHLIFQNVINFLINPSPPEEELNK